jgi:dienelactone hydrolase
MSASMVYLALALAQLGQAPVPELKAPGFDHYTCKDKYRRSIDYYLSPAIAGKNLPIAIFISGSGGQSIWPIRNGKVAGGLQSLLLSRVKDSLRVLVVEKPCVEFGFNPPRPGTAEGCSEAFLREHTLDRWTAANDAALKAALASPGVDRRRVLAIGHSEGGIVVATLAARNRRITDVASLAGGGPNQAESLATFFGKDAVEQMQKQIASDPDSTTKFIFGHPHRRWSSFMATSTIEQALKSRARFFIGQGTKDRSVDPVGADKLEAALRAQNRDVTLVKVADGDHGFSTDPADRTGKGFSAMFDQVLAWFNKK